MPPCGTSQGLGGQPRLGARRNIAADLAAGRQLLGLYDCDGLKNAEPNTLRYRLLALPARLVRHARKRILKISATWPWKEAFTTCWRRLCALPAPG